MDRPVAPNMFGSPVPDPERYEYPASDPERIDPPGCYAHMPPSAPDPVEGSTAPMTGDVPPMRTPSTVHRFDPWNFRDPVYRDKVGGYYDTTYSPMNPGESETPR